MAKGEIAKNIVLRVIEWLVKKILPLLLGILAGLSTFFLSIKNELVKHPNVLLVSLAIMVAITVLFFILWIRICWRYAWFKEAFGVYWDKNYNMRCINCRKPLKHSSLDTDPSIFYCPDKKNCKDARYVLKDTNGTKITQQIAIDRLKANT